jgi:putative ABC transport system substrate-binding protein
MKRRAFITLLGGAAVARPLVASAQQPTGRMRRVGIVMPYAKSDPEFGARDRAFREEPGKLGWTDGDNVRFDERWTTDNMDTCGPTRRVW